MTSIPADRTTLALLVAILALVLGRALLVVLS